MTFPLGHVGLEGPWGYSGANVQWNGKCELRATGLGVLAGLQKVTNAVGVAQKFPPVVGRLEDQNS